MIDEKKFMEFMTVLEDAGAEHVSFDDLRKFVDGFPKIGGWIPCSEPPKHDKEVLIFNGKSYSVGYYDGKTWINAIHPVEWQEIYHGQMD